MARGENVHKHAKQVARSLSTSGQTIITQLDVLPAPQPLVNSKLLEKHVKGVTQEGDVLFVRRCNQEAYAASVTSGPLRAFDAEFQAAVLVAAYCAQLSRVPHAVVVWGQDV